MSERQRFYRRPLSDEDRDDPFDPRFLRPFDANETAEERERREWAEDQRDAEKAKRSRGSKAFKMWLGMGKGSEWRGPAGEDRDRALRLQRAALAKQELYVAGRRFKVLKEGGQLQSVVDMQRWPLEPGNVVTCFGASEPWGSRGHRLITFGGAKGQVLGNVCVFAPSVGTHRVPYPEPGYLEALEI